MRNVNVTAAYWVEETRQGVVSAYFDRLGSKLLETSFGLNYANRGKRSFMSRYLYSICTRQADIFPFF